MSSRGDSDGDSAAYIWVPLVVFLLFMSGVIIYAIDLNAPSMSISQTTVTSSIGSTVRSSSSANFSNLDATSPFGKGVLFQANHFHQYGRDHYGRVSTPFIVELDGTSGRPTYYNGFSLHADQLYIQAYEVSTNQTYLNWAKELLDWEWGNEVVNGFLADYNASSDLTIPVSDIKSDASFISANLEMYLVSGNPAYLTRAEGLTRAFWSNATAPNSMIPCISLNPQSLKSIGPVSYSYDLNEWIYPPLSLVANITGSQAYKDNLWTMTQSLYGRVDAKSMLAPSSMQNGSAAPDVEFHKATLGVYALLEAGEILGDSRYTQIGLEQISQIDEYMWAGNHRTAYYDAVPNSYAHWFTASQLDGTVSSDHVGTEDAAGLAGFLEAYRVTGNQTYKNHAYLFAALLNQTQWDGYKSVMIPANIELNGGGQALTNDSRLSFPDSLITAYFYGYQLTKDRLFLNLLNSVANSLSFYETQYGFGCYYDAVANSLSGCPPSQETQFFGYENAYLIVIYNASSARSPGK